MRKNLLFFIILGIGFVSYQFLKPEKQIRVYADISGDLFHSGHIEFFKKAKALGNYLIIGVLSDETISSYKRQPILSLEERVKAIEACSYVDEVIPDCPLRTDEEWLKKHRIDLVVHGDDFAENMQEDHYAIPIKMGIFKLVPYTEGISTTDIINRVKEQKEDAVVSN